jgi:hypothetical protein
MERVSSRPHLVDYPQNKHLLLLTSSLYIKGKGKVHPCTDTEAVYRPYGPQGLYRYSSTLSWPTALKGGGVRGQCHVPTALYPRERPGTHRTGGWVGPSAGLDKWGKSRPHRDSIPGPSSTYPVAIPTELPGPLLSMYICNIYDTKFNLRVKLILEDSVFYFMVTRYCFMDLIALSFWLYFIKRRELIQWLTEAL